MGSRDRSQTKYVREVFLSEADKKHVIDMHSARSKQLYPNKTHFPDDWDDEQIIQAVEDTLDNPDKVVLPNPPNDRIIIEKEISSVIVRAQYYKKDGLSIFRTAYPLF